MKILRPNAAAAKVGLSRMHLYRLERAGLFPRRVHLGPNSVGWLEEELDQWIRERADARRATSSPAATPVFEPARRVLHG